MSMEQISIEDAENIGALDKPSLRAETVRDHLMRVFVGTNFEAYEVVYEKSKQKKAQVTGWCWSAALVPHVWLLYRKLYLEAIVIFMLPIVVVSLFPDLSYTGMTINGVIAVLGKKYYLERAQKKIDKISLMRESEEVKTVLISKAGGVSWPAAVIGIVTYLSMIIIVVAARQSI